MIDPAGRTTAWEYDAYGSLLVQTLPDGSAVRTEFDLDHRPVCMTLIGGRQWGYEWNTFGNLLAQSDPSGAISRYTYDEYDQLVEHTGPRGASTRFDYHPDGNLAAQIDALGHRTQYRYDARGYLVEAIDALGQQTQYEYDRNGHLTRAIEPGGREIHCAYDADGNLSRHRDPMGHVTQVEYSALGQVSRRLAPDGTTVEYRYDSHITSAGFRTRPIGRLPMFACQTCRRYFSRTAAPPLGEKHLKKLDLFVSLLSHPISCVDAGEQMGSLSTDIGKRVTAWRAWLLELDPSGKWERRVRLSHRPPHCPNCGSHQTRFDECSNGAFPRFKCANCGTKFTRRRGTPFVNAKMSSPERMRLVIRRLSLPLLVMQVADLVGTSHGMVRKWHSMFTDFADRLEPSGSLSARIRLRSNSANAPNK
ncbi:substrate-binding repeat-containing protein [Burkholderia pseudomallei]|nr:substrate-binding repeat-containing protein [Burkholderia pseudomallei]CAJ7853076.1 substrate-binding repeat-containing protein [Burkholderia pseudomallei]CAJ9928361.1 substrate-binding repeat-containing protein [Burkholderia pseudomallei]CAK0198183.1 substrate-binding repeat-containing protein [Burkholderia pseudomallei]